MEAAVTGAAFAQNNDSVGLEFVSRAVKAYDSGDYKAAAASLDEAFQAGLSKDLSARAILLRAQINEHNGAFARALQDYSNALWMDTLPASERKKASEGKQRVITAMGLNTPAPTPAGPGGVRAASAPAGAPSSQQGGGVLNMFSGLFGSSQQAPAPVPPAPKPQPSWQTETSATPVLTRTKEAAAEQVRAPAPTKVAQSAKLPPPIRPEVSMASLQPVSVTSAPAANGFLIVFGSASDASAGRTKAHQIKTALADILVNRNLEVEARPEGGFLIVAGPYKAKGAALALCSAMKQRGVPCQVTP